MNYMIYAKHITNDRCFSPVNLSDGTYKNKLFFASLIPDKEKAISYAVQLEKTCKDYLFQVREAGKAKIVYKQKSRNDNRFTELKDINQRNMNDSSEA